MQRLRAHLIYFLLVLPAFADARDVNLPIAPVVAPVRSEKERERIIATYHDAEREAESGNTDAMLMLGRAYHLGDVYPQDTSRAWDWYLKSYRGGNILALNNIAIMF